jgi:hypothetical protein
MFFIESWQLIPVAMTFDIRMKAVAQVLIRLAHQSPFNTVSAPRMHCSFSGKVSLEAACFRNDILPRLKNTGSPSTSGSLFPCGEDIFFKRLEARPVSDYSEKSLVDCLRSVG